MRTPGQKSNSLQSVIGREYTILFSTDLISWAPLAGAELITADEVDEAFVHSPTPDSRGFYRIVEGYTPATRPRKPPVIFLLWSQVPVSLMKAVNSAVNNQTEENHDQST